MIMSTGTSSNLVTLGCAYPSLCCAKVDASLLQPAGTIRGSSSVYVPRHILTTTLPSETFVATHLSFQAQVELRFHGRVLRPKTAYTRLRKK